MYDKILVPLDGSAMAEVALPYAEELAGRLGSEVIITYVAASPQEPAYRERESYIQEKVEAIKRGADKYLEGKKEKAVKVEPAILKGDPAEEIVNYADKANIGLIVMATHGLSGIKRWALGSVADKVVRAARQPVALIRGQNGQPGVRARGMLNKITVPLDGSKESEAVIPYIEDLASKLKAEVTLLLTVAQVYYVYPAVEGAFQIPYTEEEMEPVKANAEEYLKKIAARLKDRNIEAKHKVTVGDAAEEIIRIADETHTDLVAMSTHGRSGISRWAFGSVAGKVLQGGNTPLLLVRVSEAPV